MEMSDECLRAGCVDEPHFLVRAMQSVARALSGDSLAVDTQGATSPAQTHSPGRRAGAIRAGSAGELTSAPRIYKGMAVEKALATNGEAVAETLRSLPNTRWLARSFNVRLFGRRPCQAMLNGAYTVLADLRPLLGCESCGISPPWLRRFHWMVQRIKGIFKARNHNATVAHLTTRPALKLIRRPDVV
jgi:hypothetical protein